MKIKNFLFWINDDDVFNDPDQSTIKNFFIFDSHILDQVTIKLFILDQ